jgi:hypothetical protein
MKKGQVSFLVIMLVAVTLAITAATALGHKPDKAEGVVRTGDRVIYFTDANADGFFERNVALVADDVNAVGRLNGTGVQFGNRVNLWVFPSEESGIAEPYFVDDAERGRSIGEYEALVTSNH